uniref:C1q domain-containing protein n=1 Tax=Pinctada imbricata TaxID=66713 RepID=A0A7H9STE8_PINIB|nr:C1q domain-containing protein [Pinctada imbricata]
METGLPLIICLVCIVYIVCDTGSDHSTSVIKFDVQKELQDLRNQLHHETTVRIQFDQELSAMAQRYRTLSIDFTDAKLENLEMKKQLSHMLLALQDTSNQMNQWATLNTSIESLRSEVQKQNETIRLLKGADVAFQAKLVRTIGSTMTAHKVVVFDNVEINVGNGYSTRTGKFTVPEDGIYVFHWTCMTHTNNVFRTELVVDGNIKVGNHAAANFPTDAHDTGSQMYTGRLTKNNQVWIRTFHTETYLRGDGWSAFSGYKL